MATTSDPSSMTTKGLFFRYSLATARETELGPVSDGLPLVEQRLVPAF
jgi:hypothetical protein